MYNCYGATFDASGNLYIADFDNNLIRIVNTSGIISTIAGNGFGGDTLGGYSGDGGPATNAELYHPYAVTIDRMGNLYIADCSNDAIREVNTSGIIYTVAGNGVIGYLGDGGPATSAELYYPTDVILDTLGDFYIAEYQNYVIRKVNSSGIISTIAGNYLYGNGYSGDGGPATGAEIGTPVGIAFDASGNLFIAEYNFSIIREVNTSGIISTAVGNSTYHQGYSGDGGPASAAEIYLPTGIGFDALGNFYICDRANNVIREVNTSGIINSIVGNIVSGGPFGGGYSGDGGPATSAELFWPMSITFDAYNNLYIADAFNNVIRKVGNIPTTVSSLQNENRIIISPNPSNGKFAFQSSVNSSDLCIYIYNILGENVFKGEVNNEIDLSYQPNGVYLYRVKDATGRLLGDGKLVVER